MVKLTIEVIELNKSVGKSYSSHIYFKPFFKHNNNPLSKSAQISDVNLKVEGFKMDNFFTYHQSIHLEKTCTKWIDSMTLVIN